jgi:hypothetical protein
MYQKIAIAVVLLAAPVAALAHHGWGSFDASNRITVEGPIKASEYSNPHVTVKVKAPDQLWIVILAPVSRMQSRGAAKELVSVGKTIRVEGYPSKSHKDEMRADRITIDGRTFEMR